MTPIVHLEGVAAPLRIANVDTDQIIPGRYLKRVSREGLRDGLLYAMRYDQNDAVIPEFILNRTPYNHACILVALENFGCGSSREHAPWALLDFGIRCVVAASFADIFYTNCLKNGLLPVILSKRDIESLLNRISDPHASHVVVDLVGQHVLAGDLRLKFDIAPAAKQRLILGEDDILSTLAHQLEIEAFENHADPGNARRAIPAVD